MEVAREAAAVGEGEVAVDQGWVINKKTKRIILLEYKRTSDTLENYYKDMKRTVDKQHTPGRNTVAKDRR